MSLSVSLSVADKKWLLIYNIHLHISIIISTYICYLYIMLEMYSFYTLNRYCVCARAKEREIWVGSREALVLACMVCVYVRPVGMLACVFFSVY